jgi:DNA-binding transcriptional LysR family regulator
MATQRAARSAPVLRVGIVDASYDSMPQILCQVRKRYPDLEIHEIEAGVPEQVRMLVNGRLDVGLGQGSLAPPEVAAELFRLDPVGVLVPDNHRLALSRHVPVAALAAEPLLLAEEGRAPEFNQFVIELCRLVGFTPMVYRGTVHSIRAASDLVIQGRCSRVRGRLVRPGDCWNRVAAAGRAGVPLSLVRAVAAR